MKANEPRDRSVSGDIDARKDSELDSQNGDGINHPGKPGRKKNPNSQAARRDQNRIAQREFRLRKQQRIRDLEARVEILSGGKDEALGEMRNILKDLMAENQTLRNLLRSLGGFIGDGAGGLLPKLGWDMADFNAYVNKSETDTAWESYQRRKKQSMDVNATKLQGQKRSADEESASAFSKRVRSGEEGEQRQEDFSLLVPMNAPSVANNGIYPANTRPQESGSMFSELMRSSSNSPMYIQPPASAASSGPPYSASTSISSNYQPSYIPAVNINIEPSIPPIPFNAQNASVQQPVSQQQQPKSASLEAPDEEDDPNKTEAHKLIHYHLDNYKRNNQYCLPSSLRPSVVQRTVPHESVIDVILHPELRDRMILLRNRYDLVECLLDYRRSVTIHGDDVLAHSNWEIGEQFLRRYNFLIDKATLHIANRWRRERGEPELRLSDIGSSEQTPPA